MNVEIVPCSVEPLEKLIEGADSFLNDYELQVVDGYMPFGGALQYILNQMQGSQLWHPWLLYLFIFRFDQTVVTTYALMISSFSWPLSRNDWATTCEVKFIHA